MRSDQVLMSLVNQVLVHEEAIRLNIMISSVEIEEAVAPVLAIAPANDPSTRRTGGVEGLRRRMRSFLEFQKLRAVVVRSRMTDTFPQLNPYSRPGATPPADDVFRTLGQVETQEERLWIDWLEGARRCATIQIHDLSFGMASTTPSPTCAAPV